MTFNAAPLARQESAHLAGKSGQPLRARKLPVERMRPAEGPATVCGVAVETDDHTGLARMVAPIRIGGRLSPALVPAWEA